MTKPNAKIGNILKIVSIVLVLALSAVIVLVRVFGYQEKTSMVPGHTVSKAPAELKKSDGPRIVEEKTTIDVTALSDGLHDIGILVTEEYYFTDIVDYSESLQLFSSFKIPFTETSYIASYDGVVTAGINFSDITVVWQEDTGTLQIVLPKASVQNVDIDPESFLLRSSKNGIGTKLTVDDVNESLIELERTAKENALSKGLLDRADENAVHLVENFVKSVMGDEKYTLEIKTA